MTKKFLSEGLVPAVMRLMPREDETSRCALCDADIVYLSQFGGWNAVKPSPLLYEPGDVCPEHDQLLITGRSTGNGLGPHVPID